MKLSEVERRLWEYEFWYDACGFSGSRSGGFFLYCVIVVTAVLRQRIRSISTVGEVECHDIKLLKMCRKQDGYRNGDADYAICLTRLLPVSGGCMSAFAPK